MKRVVARLALSGATFCFSQAAPAQDQLTFWLAGGEHGIEACQFFMMSVAADAPSAEVLTFGVTVDPEHLELIGKVRLRRTGMPSTPRLLEIGAGRPAALSVMLRPAEAGTATAEVPAPAMKDVLRSFVREPALWMRIGDAAERKLTVGGREKDVESCLSILERDLDDARASRAHGEITTGFPR